MHMRNKAAIYRIFLIDKPIFIHIIIRKYMYKSGKVMYISEGVNQKYCYVCESVWDKARQKNRTPSKCIGFLNSDNSLTPNRYLSQLFFLESSAPSSLNEYERLVIKTVIDKYGQAVRGKATPSPKQLTEDDIMTARAVFIGPELVFGAITKRYRISSILEKSFGEKIMKDILSLAWYLASEGSALSDSDSWLDYYENPRGSTMSSQDVSRLLDSIDYDGMMTFYKLWLKEAVKGAAKTDKILYDLTSISYYGSSIDAAEYGYNRDHEALPQVNYALLCIRSTAMPLFAWPMNVRSSETCKKLTRKQVFSHIKTIYKVEFKGKYRDIYPELSKHQRDILEALNVRACFKSRKSP